MTTVSVLKKSGPRTVSIICADMEHCTGWIAHQANMLRVLRAMPGEQKRERAAEINGMIGDLQRLANELAAALGENQ